jgi:hypothetical protein
MIGRIVEKNNKPSARSSKRAIFGRKQMRLKNQSTALVISHGQQNVTSKSFNGFLAFTLPTIPNEVIMKDWPMRLR